MGWNDRLLDEPYRPYESDEDRDAYDNWHHYLESCRQEELSGLSSQNIDPGALTPKVRENPALAALRELVKRIKHIAHVDKN
jgi:hypothetical protein